MFATQTWLSTQSVDFLPPPETSGFDKETGGAPLPRFISFPSFHLAVGLAICAEQKRKKLSEGQYNDAQHHITAKQYNSPSGE